jgi:hypothetical protein
VQRNGHNQVSAHQFALAINDFCQSIGEPRAERFNPLKFEEQDRPYQRTIIEGKASGALECIKLVPASGAT